MSLLLSLLSCEYWSIRVSEYWGLGGMLLYKVLCRLSIVGCRMMSVGVEIEIEIEIEGRCVYSIQRLV